MRSVSIRTLSLAIIAGVFAASAACSDETQSTGTRTEEAALVRVTPQGGSTNVDPNARIQMEFDHPMVNGVEALCAVHLGGLDGEEVPGAWEWSEDHHVLTFTPHDPLQLDREHTLHVGGGIIDSHGHGMDFDQHGFDMGGHWVDEDMFGGGTMGGHSHMGDGWQHHNGTYGMAFSFRTTADSAPKVALLRVSPEGGSTNVDPNARIQMEFDHPMVDGVEALCAVHLGGLDGEEVPGAWEWSEDHHVLTFTPHDPLQLDREHTLHVGGGITDVDGHHMDFDQHGFDMGGHWVDEDMLGQHGGMMGGHSHMGDGWQHHNGYYGMAFSFRTTADSAPKVALLRVSPEGGSTNVDPNARIQMEFDHPMVDGVEALCAVHLGGLDGEEVPGAWEWSEDHHVLTFTPHDPLQLDREHTLHVGGGIIDVDGHHMDFDQHGFDMGGHWVDEDMLGQHGGMMGGHSHMDDGWQHHSGYYGMAFPFWIAP